MTIEMIDPTDGGSLVTEVAQRKCGVSRAPRGWYCTRDYGHTGPCAALPEMKIDNRECIHGARVCPYCIAVNECFCEGRWKDPQVIQSPDECRLVGKPLWGRYSF